MHRWRGSRPRLRPAPVDQDVLRGTPRQMPADVPSETADPAMSANTAGARRFSQSGVAPKTDWTSELLGEPTTSATPQNVDPFAEPDAPTWLGRRWQDLRGKQDPRYKDLPVYDGGGVDVTTMEQAKLLGPDDQGLANIIQVKPWRQVRWDQEGRKRLPDPRLQGAGRVKEISAYINRPGLDLQDVDRGVSAAIPYVAAATGAGRICP